MWCILCSLCSLHDYTTICTRSIRANENLVQYRHARKTASTLLDSIQHSDFVVGLIVLEKISGILLPVTRMLQTVGMDLVEAFGMIKDTMKVVENFRNEEKFSAL